MRLPAAEVDASPASSDLAIATPSAHAAFAVRCLMLDIRSERAHRPYKRYIVPKTAGSCASCRKPSAAPLPQSSILRPASSEGPFGTFGPTKICRSVALFGSADVKPKSSFLPRGARGGQET